MKAWGWLNYLIWSAGILGAVSAVTYEDLLWLAFDYELDALAEAWSMAHGLGHFTWMLRDIWKLYVLKRKKKDFVAAGEVVITADFCLYSWLGNGW
jgi:hypothetical protein